MCLYFPDNYWHYFFVYLSFTHLSWNVWSTFAHFFLKIGVFIILLSCRNSLYPGFHLVRSKFSKCFLPVCALPIHFLSHSFWCSLIYQVFFFFIYGYYFLPTCSSWRYSFYFCFWKFLWFYLSCWDLWFLRKVWSQGQKHSFPLCCFGAFWEPHVPVSVSIFVGALFCSIHSCFCLAYARLLLSQCYAYRVSLKVREWESFSFFKNALDILWPLHFHINFSVNLSISTKTPAGIILTCKSMLGEIDILTPLNLSVLDVLSSFNLSSFFLQCWRYYTSSKNCFWILRDFIFQLLTTSI